MMQGKRVWFFLLLTIVVMLVSVSLFAAEFSADMVSSGNGEVFSGKMYVKGNMWKMEGIQEGEKVIMIYDFDNGKMITLMPEEKMYMEMTIAKGDINDPRGREGIDELATKKVLGKEKVNGFMCEKIEYIYHAKEIGTITVWYSEKLDYYIKTKSKEGGMELKNIKVGALSSSLFKVPKDYQKMGFSF